MHFSTKVLWQVHQCLHIWSLSDYVFEVAVMCQCDRTDNILTLLHLCHILNQWTPFFKLAYLYLCKLVKIYKLGHVI